MRTLKLPKRVIDLMAPNSTHTVVVVGETDFASGDTLALVPDDSTEECGTAYVVSCWSGPFAEIPAKIINEIPDRQHHTYNGLFCALRQTCEGFAEETKVTGIRLTRIS